jgi:hypothetical protein
MESVGDILDAMDAPPITTNEADPVKWCFNGAEFDSESEAEIARSAWAKQWAKPVKVEPFVPATLADAPKLPPPGIYFGMPEDVYHALPALSSSGVKSILASPMQYWAGATWLSETARKREKRERENPKTQITRIVGKAYHCRLLEGASEFALRFARDLAPEDCEGALTTTEQIKAAIEGHGEKPVSKVADQLPDGQAYQRSAKKDDWIEQLLRLDPNALILDVLQREHVAEHDGKHFLSADAWEQIEIAARLVELDPGCKHAFRGGFAETTLIWTDEETGVPMKARPDYLKSQIVVDLKSIACDGRSIDTALRMAIARWKYTFQVSHYLAGVQAVKALVRETEGACIRSADGSPAANAEREWATKWAAAKDEPKWLFCFQAKGDAPVTRGVGFPTRGMTRQIADDMRRTAARKFRECSEAYSTDPWLDVAPVYDLSDEDIPQWATDV